MRMQYFVVGRPTPRGILALCCVTLLVMGTHAAAAGYGPELEREPINYATARTDNRVTRLEQRLLTGTARLRAEEDHGYLRSLLHELKIPVSSQVLVFSKTSLQRHRIGPKTPRAIYFNDDTYVGFCLQGDVIEVSAVDTKLGEVFYTLDQTPAGKPRFTRQNDSCMICHGSSQNQGLPGNLVRSLFVDAEGQPLLSAGSYRTDQSSPLKERWGGWYVTGTTGTQTHLGNLIVRDKRRPEDVDTSAGMNVTDLSERFATSLYLASHSDVVALMVLEHQAEMHNRICRANLLTRLALRDEDAYNKAFNRPATYRSESFAGRIKGAGEPLVKYLLFSEEAALSGPVRGSSTFAAEFAQRGPVDRRGRSLRQLDLERRLFCFPCSYLIYSPAFDSLPTPVKDYVLHRVWEVLSGSNQDPEYNHLSVSDRQAILEILLETKPNLPEYWKTTQAATAPRAAK